MFGFDPTFGFRRRVVDTSTIDPSLFLVHEILTTETGARLFLSSRVPLDQKQDLSRFEIARIVSVTELVPEVSIPKEDHLIITLPDVVSVNLADKFEEVHKFLEDACGRGQNVLVHCDAGVSRSATVIISFVMKTKRLTARQAYQMVKDKRPCIAPNISFIQQLIDYEEKLLGTKDQEFMSVYLTERFNGKLSLEEVRKVVLENNNDGVKSLVALVDVVNNQYQGPRFPTPNPRECCTIL